MKALAFLIIDQRAQVDIEQDARALAEAFGALEVDQEHDGDHEPIVKQTSDHDGTLETLVEDEDDYLNPLTFETSDEVFTEEELLSALNDIGKDPFRDNIESDSEDEAENVLLSKELPGLPEITDSDLELPELDILDIKASAEEDLLKSVEALDQVFQEAGKGFEGAEYDQGFEETRPHDLNCECCVGDQQESAVDLLNQLEALNLDLEGPESVENILTEEDDVPPWFYCQPCNTENVEDIASERNIYNEQALDSLLDLRGLRLDDSTYAMAQEDLGQVPLSTQAPKAFSVRPEVRNSSKPLLDVFNVEIREDQIDEPSENPPEEQCILGNKERILGVQISPCGKYMATAGQDSIVGIFDIESNTEISCLRHDRAYECLRVAWASSTWASESIDRTEFPYILATGAANGEVRIYHTKDPSLDDWILAFTLNHADMPHFHPQDPKDTPQIYALQFIDDYKAVAGDSKVNSLLLTSSDDHVHLWDIDTSKRSKQNAGEEGSEQSTRVWHLNEVMSLYFADMHGHGYGVQVGQVTSAGIARASQATGAAVTSSFGGDRNPQGLVYVFDACYCPVNSLLGVALSDGSLRLMNGRGVCISLIQLPGHKSHLTSFAWDATGKKLATCVATGHLILWGMKYDQGEQLMRTTCDAVLEGGHIPGRPLFGAKFFGENDDVVISWGVDGRLCLWDAKSKKEHDRPLAILLDKPDYPIYAVDMNKDTIAVTGGSDNGASSLIGVPSFLYRLKTEEGRGGESKRAKSTADEPNAVDVADTASTNTEAKT